MYSINTRLRSARSGSHLHGIPANHSLVNIGIPYPGPLEFTGSESNFTSQKAIIMALYFWIAAGSAIGGVCRFALSGLVAHRFGETLPWGTFAVNFIGSLLIGFIACIASPDGRILFSPTARHMLMTGILGGFTTYSSFSLQTLNLVRDGDFLKAGAYAAGTLIFCFVAVWIGHAIASSINTINPA